MQGVIQKVYDIYFYCLRVEYMGLYVLMWQIILLISLLDAEYALSNLKVGLR